MFLSSQPGLLLFVLERQISNVFSPFAVFIVFKSLQKEEQVLTFIYIYESTKKKVISSAIML